MLHVTNDHGNFSKSISLNTYCAKKISEQALQVIKAFNKSTQPNSDAWFPPIKVLGMSATKFTELNKEKSTIQNYFSSKAETKPTSSSNTHQQEPSQADKPSNELQKSPEEQKSKQPKNDIKALFCKQIKNNQSLGTSHSNNSISNGANEKALVANDEESCGSDVVFIEDSREVVEKEHYESHIAEPLPVIVENEDYIECEKCKKKILVWDMPEHTDYHFALELAGMDKPNKSESMMSNLSEAASTSSRAVGTSNKRSLNEASKNSETSTSKKMKKNNNNDAKSVKSIQNYFKKA